MSWCLGEMAEGLRWERFPRKRDGAGFCVPSPAAQAHPGRLPLGPVPTGQPLSWNPGSCLTAWEEVSKPVVIQVFPRAVNIHWAAAYGFGRFLNTRYAS